MAKNKQTQFIERCWFRDLFGKRLKRLHWLKHHWRYGWPRHGEATIILPRCWTTKADIEWVRGVARERGLG